MWAIDVEEAYGDDGGTAISFLARFPAAGFVEAGHGGVDVADHLDEEVAE